MDEVTALDGVPLQHRRVKLSEVELHVVEAGARYPADNWLQRGAGMPARGFAS